MPGIGEDRPRRNKSSGPIDEAPQDNKKMWLILGSIAVALIVAIIVAIAVTQ